MTQHPRNNVINHNIIKRSKAGRFKIEGIVIDENGNPLNDVRLRITKAISRGFLGSKTSSRNEIIKAKFSLNESGCNALFLEFYKKGYFVVNRSYTIKMKAEKNIYPKGNLLTAKKQTIVVREIGKLAKLKNKDRKFYLNLISKKQDIMDLISFKKMEINNIKDIKTEKYFSLSVKSDTDGKPVMIFDKQTEKMVPEKIFLNYISNKKTDGIILVDNAKDMRDLPTAPEKGYSSRQIQLEINYFTKIFFYYKNGNTYGKVWVRQTSYTSEKVKCILLIKENIEKAPKEKHNLRSMKW